MPSDLRARLHRLASRDYRPDAWRRRDDVVELRSQFDEEYALLSAQYERWIPYTMPALEAVRQALQDGTIQPAAVPQIIRSAFISAFERGRPRITRSMMRLAINLAA